MLAFTLEDMELVSFALEYMITTRDRLFDLYDDDPLKADLILEKALALDMKIITELNSDN